MLTSRRYCQDVTNALWNICQNIVRSARDEHPEKTEEARVHRMLFVVRNLLVSFTSVAWMLNRLHVTLTDDDGLTLALVDLGEEVGEVAWERKELGDFKEALNDGKVVPFRRPS